MGKLLVLALYICALATKSILASCPIGTVRGPSGDCYSLHYSPLSWFEAEILCRSKGAHIASISGAITDAFTNELSRNWCYAEYWLGASNIQNNNWRWLDGSSFRYTNWAQGNFQTRMLWVWQRCVALT